MNNVRLMDDIQTDNVIISKPRKAYFYVLVTDLDEKAGIIHRAHKINGYTTVCRYHGAECAVGYSKEDGRYRVFDLSSGMMLSVEEDIDVCRGADSVRKRLPMIISRWIDYLEKRPASCRRYWAETIPAMECELITIPAEAEYMCFYRQYSAIMADWAKDTELDNLSVGGAA